MYTGFGGRSPDGKEVRECVGATCFVFLITFTRQHIQDQSFKHPRNVALLVGRSY